MVIVDLIFVSQCNVRFFSLLSWCLSCHFCDYFNATYSFINTEEIFIIPTYQIRTIIKTTENDIVKIKQTNKGRINKPKKQNRRRQNPTITIDRTKEKIVWWKEYFMFTSTVFSWFYFIFFNSFCTSLIFIPLSLTLWMIFFSYSIFEIYWIILSGNWNTWKTSSITNKSWDS